MSYEIVRRHPDGRLEVVYDGDETTRVVIPKPAADEGTAAFDKEIEDRRDPPMPRPRWSAAPIDDVRFEKPPELHDRRRP